MKISYNWIKDFVDTDLSPTEAAETLTLAGLEVDSVDSYGSRLDGVVVGEIMEVRDHPDADRLTLCNVDIGNEQVQIVCGADNVRKNLKVPVATVGTTLPVTLDSGEPLQIRETTIRGEVSRGMICAEDELGIGTDHSGVLVLNDEADIGAPISDQLDLYEDTILDIELTPNRPDASCHLGVARDLAAALDRPLDKPYETDLPDREPLDDLVDIEIRNPDKCHRYVGMAVTGIQVEESPKWLKNRLKAIGVRPVNNVVDATNYVLHETGQPLHAFDLDRVRGQKIVVRDYDEEITFETLDHVERTCSPGTLFICDGEGPVAIAGVIGGVDSEVGGETRNVLLESAWFEPGTIRRTAKEQALQTDASYRFERGVDPNLQRVAAERCVQLIAELTGGTVEEGCTDVHPRETEPEEIRLRVSRLNRLLGTDLSAGDMTGLLTRLELEPVEEDDDAVTYRVPTFRPDLKREVDLIEEVGRLYDYNKIPVPTHTKFTEPESISDHEKFLEEIKDKVKALGFQEIYSNSLMPEEDAERLGSLDRMIHTLNPISRDMTTLRPSLLYGFLKAVSYNFNRKQRRVRFFEVGNVFRKSEDGSYYEGIMEETHLLMGIAGLKTVEHWKTEPEPYDLFDLKAPVTALLEQLDLKQHLAAGIDGKTELVYRSGDSEIGRLYRVAPSLLETYEIEQPAFAAEWSLTRIERLLEGVEPREYRPVSKYPTFEFDLAVIVDRDTPAGNLIQTIRKTAGDQLDDLTVFDVFQGELLGDDKKSIAFRLSFLDKTKTLTINDIEPIINKILDVLDAEYSAKLRS